MAIWFILWQFGAFCGHFSYFSSSDMLYHEKYGNPGLDIVETLEFKSNTGPSLIISAGKIN
jgi:hypothetical protein